MKKKTVLVLSAAMTMVLGLGACGKKNNKNTSSSSSESHQETTYTLPGAGSINDTTPDFKKALEADYSNVTVHYAQEYGNESYYEEAYEYYVNGYTVVFDQTAAENGYPTDYCYTIYHDYQNDNYTYWSTKNGYAHDGWISNGFRDADLAIHNAYFSIPHLLSAITENDVEYMLGSWFVKASAMDKINANAFEFYGDPMSGGSDLTAISFILDDQGRFAKIIGSVSDNSDDGVQIVFDYYGTTQSPITLPAAPSASNIYTYAEMKGDDYVPDVYAEALTISLVDEHKSDATHDLVLDIDESIDALLTIAPENTNVMNWTWLSTNPEVASTNYKESTVSRHKYISGVGAGECEIYAAYTLRDGTSIFSNHIKVKVNEAAQISKENAVYDLKITGDQVISEDKNDEAYSSIFASNSVDTTAQYTITAHNMSTLEAKYTDSFGSDGVVLVAKPSSSEFMNYGFYSSMTFDFGDQEVTGLSFHYALHKANQKADAIRLLSQAYISTSSDGVNWSDPIDMKEEMVSEFDKINLDYLSNLKIMSRSFAKATKVKIFYKSNMVGGNLNLCMNDFVFYHDDTCHDHSDVVDVPVTGVTIATSTSSLKVGASTQMFVSSVLPENATNKNVTWTSSDETVATVSSTGVVNALKAGTTEIYAVSSNGVESNKITITVIGQEYLPESVIGTYMAEDLIIDLKYYDIKVEIKDTTSAKVTLTPQGEGEAKVFNFTYDTYDEDNKSIAPYCFKSSDGTLKMKITSDNVEMYLNAGGIKLGNTNIWEGESLKKYVASTSIKLTQSSKEISSLELIEGKSAGVTATVAPTNAYYTSVSATAADPTVVKVEKHESQNYFTITALKAGTTTITFTNADGVEKTLSVTVKAEVMVSSITLTADKTSINKGDAATITTTLNEGVTKKSLKYTSSDPTIATVAVKNGIVTVTGIKAGTVTITCKDEYSEVTGTIDITVNEVSAIIPASLVGTWTSDYASTDVLTINSDGTGTFTAEGYSGTCDVTITLKSSSAKTYVFETSEGVEITVEVGGSGIYVTYGEGSMDDIYYIEMNGTLFTK